MPKRISPLINRLDHPIPYPWHIENRLGVLGCGRQLGAALMRIGWSEGASDGEG